jgi:hypothetical protein
MRRAAAVLFEIATFHYVETGCLDVMNPRKTPISSRGSCVDT